MKEHEGHERKKCLRDEFIRRDLHAQLLPLASTKPVIRTLSFSFHDFITISY